MRLQMATWTIENRGAWTFDNFRLTTTDDSSAKVPEPATLLLLGAGLLGIAGAYRRK